MMTFHLSDLWCGLVEVPIDASLIQIQKNSNGQLEIRPSMEVGMNDTDLPQGCQYAIMSRFYMSGFFLPIPGLEPDHLEDLLGMRCPDKCMMYVK